MEGTLKVKFHPSSCHQAGLGALYRFLLCENLLAEIKILDVLKKKKVLLIVTKICGLSLLALSCFLTGVDGNRKKTRYLGYVLQMNDRDKLQKRDLIPSGTGLRNFLCLTQRYWV